MSVTKFCINALDTSITIAAGETKEYLEKLLDKFKNELDGTRSSTKLENKLKIAILTGFTLCDEIEKLKTENEKLKRKELKAKSGGEEDPESSEAERLTLKLIAQLDNAFDTNGEPVSPAPPPKALPEISSYGNGKKRKPEILKLVNPVKNYSWGSPDLIPGLIGEENPSRLPWAELWMGVHPEGPSRLAGTPEDPAGPLLSSIIAGDPLYYLGKETEKTFGGLPFLFKALAAEKPLSIQAHPNLKQARDGWERENRAGVGPKAAGRNYKDPNHKPEIICALTPFTAMCGFREEEEIKTLLGAFSQNAGPFLKDGLEKLALSLNSDFPLKSFFASVFDMEESVRKELCTYAQSGAAAEAYPRFAKEFKLVSLFAELYPSDPAVIAPLYLNLIELNPGEAIYLPAGILHAYVKGLGIELMANSDNVLRGGLTPKHIDRKELFSVLDFNPWKPQVTGNIPAASGGAAQWEISENKASFYKYPSPCREFSLISISSCDMIYKEKGPSIIFVTEGELAAGPLGNETFLRKGEAAFVPAAEAEAGFRISGNYTAWAAVTGVNISGSTF